MQAALSTFLLIIYNCSGQLLTTRARRLAKSREAAARSARETAIARQRWKAAKDAAKKHASGLQSHLSRTFSRRTDAERFQILNQDSPNEAYDFWPADHARNSTLPPNQRKRENIELMQTMDEIEEDSSHNLEDSNPGSVGKNKKGNIKKAKHMHTHTQIFKYAYSQLEKERAQEQKNKDLSFSGVISMATISEIRKRPLIEVSFMDLTLTLKGKKKHLLRCVTGKLRPGRIAAVMGPSGAGKTSFLSALAGKAVGCSTTGVILINGKRESIHSYKKITGFVPQDDIVHGNLTVEENLWFSAKCRYGSVDLLLLLQKNAFNVHYRNTCL